VAVCLPTCPPARLPACLSGLPALTVKKRNRIRAQAVEGGDAGSAGMGAAFDEETGHLQPSHCAFLKQWMALVDMEESGLLDRRAEIWNMPGEAPGAEQGTLDPELRPRRGDARRASASPHDLTDRCREGCQRVGCMIMMMQHQSLLRACVQLPRGRRAGVASAAWRWLPPRRWGLQPTTAAGCATLLRAARRPAAQQRRPATQQRCGAGGPPAVRSCVESGAVSAVHCRGGFLSALQHVKV
jgi:hypothetical protein